MEDIVYYGALFDYYGALLSEKEKSYFKDYYFENLSLQEIADNNEISREAARKSIKSAKEKMIYFESILNLLEKKNKIKDILEPKVFEKIEKYI